MGQKAVLDIGAEAGLRFALLLDGMGGARSLDWEGIESWMPEHGYLWVHLERDDPVAQEWVRRKSGIDPLICLAILAEESRPRVFDMGETMTVVLRGVNVADENNAVELVPLHLAVQKGRLISLRDKGHQLSALRDTRLALLAGKGPRNGADLLAAIAEKTIDHVGPVIDDLEEELAALEASSIEPGVASDSRADLARLRLKATTLRRYIAPEREAIYRLQHDEDDWLSPRARLRLREVSERIIHHLEDIEALRDRAIILHEDLTAKVSEQIAQTSNRLTALAAMLLPPSLLTGLLGINVEGIPAKDNPHAFLYVCLIILAMVPSVWLFLKRSKWL